MIAKKREVRLLLDNIRSVHNVGSIFRTADAAGVTKIYCIGTTPSPLDRFGQKRTDLNKVALGAEESVAWEYMKSAATIIHKLRKEKFHIVALEQAKGAVDYRRFKVKSATLLIVGNEVDGVSKSLLESADDIIEIPMKGKKESLNVAVATGIVLFSICK